MTTQPSLETTERATAMLARLKEEGLKLTPQRIAIVREIADDLSHPTAQDLFERLRTSFPTMSFATVYNTLDALARCGLTHPLHLGPGSRSVRFDPNVAPHHHAVCDGCGTITDLPPTASTPASTVPGFRVRSEERIYRGLCGRCIA